MSGWESAFAYRFPNDLSTVVRVLRGLPEGTKMAVETMGSWWWFVVKAREMGHEVYLIHPKQTYRKRSEMVHKVMKSLRM